MVERRTGPRGGGMARVASRRESRRRVIGIVRALEVFQMATRARRRQARKLPTDMALITGHVYVRSRQRERRLRMIKLSTRP